MRKSFCDACCKEGAENRFSYLIHLDESPLANNQYIDNNGLPTSGREVSVELCNCCYNEIVGAAVSILKKKHVTSLNQETKHVQSR
jgi:hypothetical protein